MAMTQQLFKNFEDLYRFLSEMTKAEYDSRLDAIQNYLSSDQHKLFEPEYNAKVVIESILND